MSKVHPSTNTFPFRCILFTSFYYFSYKMTRFLHHTSSFVRFVAHIVFLFIDVLVLLIPVIDTYYQNDKCAERNLLRREQVNRRLNLIRNLKLYFNLEKLIKKSNCFSEHSKIVKREY